MNSYKNYSDYRCHDNSDKEPIFLLPIIAGGGQTVHMSMETSLMTPTEDDNHSGGGWEEQ